MNDFDEFDGEPSLVELAAIEFERPLIDAELDVLDAEIHMLYAADRGGPGEIDWQRLRRANRQLLDVARLLVNGRRHELCKPHREREVRLSDCPSGCKVMRCDECETEQVSHSYTYGCQIARQAVAS
ncbi:DUF6284 family protein [Actinoplanes rectilineatus]|uniref:DUF6284 family protein n=1 Tax=Actinoplanes rectilineatus TaxID=113571 RepID=UPI0005F2DA13|nr:DUF6284 family protein [Actinoplanes rectilineatus]